MAESSGFLSNDLRVQICSYGLTVDDIPFKIVLNYFCIDLSYTRKGSKHFIGSSGGNAGMAMAVAAKKIGKEIKVLIMMMG